MTVPCVHRWTINEADFGMVHLCVKAWHVLTPTLTLPRQGGGNFLVLPRQGGGNFLVLPHQGGLEGNASVIGRGTMRGKESSAEMEEWCGM